MVTWGLVLIVLIRVFRPLGQACPQVPKFFFRPLRQAFESERGYAALTPSFGSLLGNCTPKPERFDKRMTPPRRVNVPRRVSRTERSQLGWGRSSLFDRRWKAFRATGRCESISTGKPLGLITAYLMSLYGRAMAGTSTTRQVPPAYDVS